MTDDSLRGTIISLALIGIVITCIVNFIILFPQEQGMTFSGTSQSDYLQAQLNNNLDVNNSLDTLQSQTSDAFSQWDITQGFMGTNQLKQGQGNVISMATNTFANLRLLATQLFTSNSPIVWALIMISGLVSVYLIYVIIKFVRTGS